MLLCTLADSFRFDLLHPGFDRALAFLRQSDLARWPKGRHAVEGDRVVAIVEQRDGVGQAAAVLEAHRRYIDLQYTVAGQEVMGWRALSECRQPREAFSDERDIGFFLDAPQVWVPVPPGQLAVFYPEDAHAPLAGTGPLHKVIIKVAVA